jgi:hypothetical protein
MILWMKVVLIWNDPYLNISWPIKKSQLCQKKMPNAKKIKSIRIMKILVIGGKRPAWTLSL